MNTKPQKQKGAAAYDDAAPEAQIEQPAVAQIPYMEAPSFGTFQFPDAFRELAEKSVNQARDTYARMKTAAEDATGLVETTVDAAREGAMAFGVKALDAAKTNSDASFALARDLCGAKTFSEVIELQSTYARRLFETVTGQFKEFQQLTEKVVSDTTRPVADKVEKTFRAVAA